MPLNLHNIKKNMQEEKLKSRKMAKLGQLCPMVTNDHKCMVADHHRNLGEPTFLKKSHFLELSHF